MRTEVLKIVIPQDCTPQILRNLSLSCPCYPTDMSAFLLYIIKYVIAKGLAWPSHVLVTLNESENVGCFLDE